jgi:peptide/nickel transport system substrate-binding protein
MENEMSGILSKRDFMMAALSAPFAQPVGVSLAQTYIAGAELPPLLMESFSDQMTIEVTRLYIRELEKLGIRVVHKPLVFSQILGKVYGSKDLTSAMMGLGFPEERFDPDFYVRSIYASDGSFNIPHYSNPEFDRFARQQLAAQTLEERRQALFEAQRILARDLPSWAVCTRHQINPVNLSLFRNVNPSRGFGLECYHVAPYLEIEPIGSVKEVNVATTFRMSSAHPFTERSSNGRGYVRFIFDTFLRYDRDLKLIPWAAEKVDQVDAATYDLLLRENMKWHDGRPVTIEDAKFTFDYLLKWRPPLWEPFMEIITSAERIGDRGLRIKLKGPAATFRTISLAQITILPKHIWERVPDQVGVASPLDWDPTRSGGMVGSGPFKFVRFEKDVDCHVTANREHWTGGPKIDGVHYIQAASVEQMVGGMEAGQIHIIGDGITIIEGRRLAQRPGIKLMTTETGTFVLFWVDTSKPPFNNRAFRHALYHAVPKKAAVEIVLGGASVPARRSPIPPFMGEWIPEELLGDEYDLEKSRRYLEEAGFKRQGGKLIAP